MSKIIFKNSPIIRIIFFLLGSSFIFLLGYFFGKYQVRELLERGSNLLFNPKGNNEEVIDDFLIQHAFTDELLESDLVFEPITTLDGINKMNEEILVVLEDFENTYEKISISNVEYLAINEGQASVVKLNFHYNGKDFDSYAYQVDNPEADPRDAALIIPGSGTNQSSLILDRDESNYHFGILDFMDDLVSFQAFILIKPNEDILAFHDGNKKLNYNFITNYQLNQGGSYSASYLLQSIAFQKYLNEKYEKTLVLGLSQGGLAALLNAIESSPDFAIIASGYSIIHYEMAEWSGHDQIIIPGISQALSQEAILSSLKNSNTSWFFSYGKEEIGTYKLEAEEMWTKSLIDELSNVNVIIHEGGHQFPLAELKTFLKNN